MRERRGKVALPRSAVDAVDEALVALGRIRAREPTRQHRAGDILTLLRHHDIPCSIDSFSAQGWTAKLGNPTQGFYAQQSRFRTLDGAANWLLEEARRHYGVAMPGRA